MQNKFIALINEHQPALEKENRISNIIGFVKLFLVLLLIASIVIAILVHLWFLALCAFTFAALIAFWIYHSKIHKKIDFHQEIISICNRYIDRINGKWIDFEDTGAEFTDTDHAYSSDLDIAGKKSLFQFLNSTSTWHGRTAFANDLLYADYKPAKLKNRQEAIDELSKKIDYLIEAQYYFSKVKVDEKAPKLVEELKDDTPFMTNSILKFFLSFIPLLSLAVIAGLLIWRPGNFVYSVIMVILGMQAVIWGLGISKAKKYFGTITDLSYKFSAYSEIIKVITAYSPLSCKLKSIKEQLENAAFAIDKLGAIANRVNLRLNGIFNFFANILLLWDYGCAFSLEKWKKKYAHLVEQWFLTIGKFESLMCFANLPNVCNNTCLPDITKNQNLLEAKEIGHPLLCNDKRVNNDFELNNNILIISGSNMSGKTTFLRTVGINMVLARAGGFVCARHMACLIFPVMTSMRIVDDLNEGVSTFYAELKRISKIIDFAKTQPKVLFLIDEIFRGTNSVDRLIGARTVIEKLDKLGAMGIISTHDLELCKLSNIHGRIKNYSFSEHYSDKKICFDYKLKAGISTTTNAKYLMEMVGILD